MLEFQAILVYLCYVRRFILAFILMILVVLTGCRSQIQQGDNPVAMEHDVLAANAPDYAERYTSALVLLPEGETLPMSEFREIWVYVIDGEEEYLKPGLPISDIGYFGAELDTYGKLVNVPDPRKIAFFGARVHLVVASSSRSLTHFALLEGRPERRELIADLLEAAKSYDGIQIDFENVAQRDADSFLAFLRDLRAGLNGKMLTIALPARTRFIQNDIFDYAKINGHVDRILVMAYDEHWSGSEPGPIASMEWCRRVAAYSLEVIGREKLIMGLPFYGRTWGDINANRAFFNSGIERIKREEGVTVVERDNGVPFFSYQKTLTVTGYYDDDYSLSTRLQMYRRMGVNAAGFWRLGQETPVIWPLLRFSVE